jgi:hypothetical protein
MDPYADEEFSWDSLCDLCAGILRIEVIATLPPRARALSCEVHGLVGMTVRKPRS